MHRIENRISPASVEAERAVLGAILLNNHCYDQAASLVTADDFSLDSHRRIFKRMADLTESGKAVDFVTLADELKKNNELVLVGGDVYLVSLTDGLPRVKNITQYVKIIQDRAILRKLIHVCSGTIEAAYDQQVSAKEIYGNHDELLLQTIDRLGSGAIVKVSEFSAEVFQSLAEQMKDGSKLPGFSYGIEGLDAKTTGIRRKEFTIIGGRPKQGKTALALECIQANCEAGIPVGFFSVEMNKEAIMERLWSSVGKINFTHIRQPSKITDEEKPRLANAKWRVDDWPLFIDDSADITITELSARARLMVRKHNIALIVVDYMQIINGNGDMRQRLIKISRSLRMLAKNLNIAVIGLSQLARPNDKNMNKRPEIWDLKESGSLEADANTILMIFRPVDDEGGPTGEDEILITQRAGQAGAAIVTYVGQYMRFEPRYRE